MSLSGVVVLLKDLDGFLMTDLSSYGQLAKRIDTQTIEHVSLTPLHLRRGQSTPQ